MKKIIFLFFLVGLLLLRQENDQCCVSPVSEKEKAIPTPTVYVSPKSTSRVAKVTAYSCGGLKTEKDIKMNCPSLLRGEPKTASGKTPTPRKTVACDKKHLGKAFVLEGVGRVVCEDTGGAIRGDDRFDLYLETASEAKKWGVRYISYWQE